MIGEDCIVGANALVTEGEELSGGQPDRRRPSAKAVKQLDEKTIAFLKVSAAHYVDNGRAAMEGLERID
ncbi:hypothetical protein AB5I41_06665 [Sphingomonas sp. MMS24-JH45]